MAAATTFAFDVWRAIAMARMRSYTACEVATAQTVRGLGDGMGSMLMCLTCRQSDGRKDKFLLGVFKPLLRFVKFLFGVLVIGDAILEHVEVCHVVKIERFFFHFSSVLRVTRVGLSP